MFWYGFLACGAVLAAVAVIGYVVLLATHKSYH